MGRMDQAIYICSADGIVQYFNQQFLDFLGLPDDVAYIGARRADIFEYIIERGDLGPDDPQKLIAERMQILDRQGTYRLQQETPGGVILDIRQQLAPDGQVISTFTDITDARRLEAAVATIAEAVSHSVGQGYLQTLANALCRAVGMEWVIIGVLDTANSDSITTLAASHDGTSIENLSYPLGGSPCAEVIGQSTCVYPQNARSLFPDDEMLTELGIESYVGAPLFDADGTPLGILAAFDTHPLRDDPIAEPVLEIFASRAAAELNRLRTSEKQRVSEQRFRDFAEIGSDWLWEMDADLRFSWIADKVEDITGLAPESYVGKSRDEMRVGDNDPEVWARHMADLRARKSFKDMEIRRDLPDGRTMWIRSSGRPIFDQDGAFQGYFGSSTDITDQVNAREEAQSASERLATAIGGTEEPMALYNADDRLVICNDAYRGFHPRFAEELQPGISFQEVAKIYSDIGDGETVYDFESRMRHHGSSKPGRGEAGFPFEFAHPNGQYYQVLERHLSDGSTIILGVDVTERKESEAELRDARDRAEDANRAKSRFLASVSHELRTPLNAIIGFSEIIGSELFGPIENRSYAQYGRDIQISGQLLLGLISDILDLSQIDAEEVSLKEKPEDVADLVDECVRLFQKRAEEARIDLSVDLSNAPASIIVDSRRIKQILVNLIGNAMKFTPANGSIMVRAGFNQEGWLVLAVQDSGVGMAAEDIDRAMQPFSQLENDISRDQEGVGLGLSIASRLTALHDGELRIDSEPGAGTLAQVLLPASRITGQDGQAPTAGGG
ncbi:MAG: PAS domain S-box protein [Rhodospirillaceae bacterium]|nr:PAS domain S-box protein [Rhodospirillaceae bacterium]MBT7756005.1 PAS domain S-box protein [Rhodospirillaceae bacterium]